MSAKVPEEKWWDFFDRITRIDDELAVIINQLNAILKQLGGAPAVVETGVAKPVVTRPVYADAYKIYTIDLTVAHTDYPLGLKDDNIVATSMTVTKVDSAFSYKVNDKSGNAIEAALGGGFDAFLIKEIYITNAASSGAGKIMILFPRGGV